MSKTFLDADMDAEMEELEKDNSDSDDDNDDAEDSDDELEKEDDPELLKQIESYNEEILNNPYNYNAHLELVTCLRKTDNLEQLRKARQTFSQYYPLTAQLWIDWINDELKVAATEEEKKLIEDLFEKGVKDYTSVDLWLEYCQFSIGGIGTEEGIKKARDVFEKSLTFCGRDISRGSLLWEAFREFEMALLSMISDQQSEDYKKQKLKVMNIYKRQLRVPLIGMESTLNEYKEFIGEDIDNNVKNDFAKAKQKLGARESYENALNDEENNSEKYLEYIKFEMKEGDPVMIQQLFERAITKNCLDDNLWTEYLNYLDNQIKIPDVCLNVYGRAIRNVPWSYEIWCNYLRALERFEQPPTEVRNIFEQALGAGFTQPGAFLELWLTFIDFKRRKTEWDKEVNESMSELRNVFEKANKHLAKVKDDPDFQVSKYWANLEADHYGMMENARKIWSEVTSADPFKASSWLEYIQLEKTFGDKKHLRLRWELDFGE